MKATWRGRVIAESDRTLEVGGYIYFPRESVRMDLLQAQTAAKKKGDRKDAHTMVLVCDGMGFFASGSAEIIIRKAWPLTPAHRHLAPQVG